MSKLYYPPDSVIEKGVKIISTNQMQDFDRVNRAVGRPGAVHGASKPH